MTNFEELGNGADGWRPLFIREIRERAESEGLLQATHEILRRDNVTVDTLGHVDEVRGHDGGILFVGNHDKQFEFVALMGFLGQIGRTSMKNIVKFYVENQIHWALGPVGTDKVLPVYPRLLAADRTHKLNLELGSRLMFHRSLQTAAESARLTEKTLTEATDELSGGGIVNIFPCGSIANNMKKPWRAGVGRILTGLPETARDDVLVVPYHANNINRARLLAAVVMRGKGVLARPQHIDIAFGQPVTAAEAIASVPEPAQDDPVRITDALRLHYSATLAPDGRHIS